MNIWFTSDTHFGHKNILKFARNTRRGATVEEMNELLIDQWNSQVQPHDTVYHLGDLSFLPTNKTIEILARLNGHIHLTKGNHDWWLNKESAQYLSSVDNYRSFHRDGKRAVLMHYPIFEWDRMHHGSYHFHGHTHGHTGLPGRIFDVGIDARTDNSMALYHWDELVTIMESLPINKHH